jgi:hypothetical protein
MDATDIAVPETRYRGRSQAFLYNTIRPHASLGYCLRRVAGCATPSGSAGHAGATANIKLTFHLDHSAGADQPTESAEQKFAACEPLTKTFNSRLLIRNRGPGSRPPWEPP